MRPVEQWIDQCEWTKVGDITAAHAVLGVAERLVGSEGLEIEEHAIYYPSRGNTAFDLRVISDGSEDDSNVVEVYAARGEDSWTHVGQITCAQGQQVHEADVDYFADTMTVVQSDASFGQTEYGTAANNICHVITKTKGYDRFLFIVSTLTSTTVTLEAAKVGVAA